jgi:hypothetical protein
VKAFEYKEQAFEVGRCIDQVKQGEKVALVKGSNAIDFLVKSFEGLRFFEGDPDSHFLGSFELYKVGVVTLKVFANSATVILSAGESSLSNPLDIFLQELKRFARGELLEKVSLLSQPSARMRLAISLSGVFDGITATFIWSFGIIQEAISRVRIPLTQMFFPPQIKIG